MDLDTPFVSEPASEVGEDSEKFSVIIDLIAKY